MIELFIDRVGNVNIFNILDSHTSNSPSHVQSIVDSDLIFEYIKEVESIAHLSRTLDGLTKEKNPRDLLFDLKSLGETFFDQFFPAEVASTLKYSTEKYLHLNLDLGLKDIPWEMLHDGNQFLGDKFFIGKSVKGSTPSNSIEELKKIKMLIIADPNEDLDWAQREGEELYKILKEKISPSILDLHFISGSGITKLKLLGQIKGKNIIHYSGHLYFSEEASENGWLLSQNKILKAREIVNSGFAANLVFSNSCQSSKSTVLQNSDSSLMNFYAGSFLASGISAFIGTNWEVSDNEKTIDFSKRFYLNLFGGKSIGESLFLAREYARRNYGSNDFTWANYVLHGYPSNILLVSRKDAGQKVMNLDLIRKYFPVNISRTYLDFSNRDQFRESPKKLYEEIIRSFIEFSKTIGLIIFSDHIQKTPGKLELTFVETDFLKKWWEMIYICMTNFKKLEISMIMNTLMEVLSTHRDLVFKMIGWIEINHNENLSDEVAQGYLVTFQYYYENILMELNEFESIQLFYFPNDSENYISLCGYDSKEFNQQALSDLSINYSSDFLGKIVMYHKLKQRIIILNEFKTAMNYFSNIYKLKPFTIEFGSI